MKSHASTLSGHPAAIEEVGQGPDVLFIGAAVPMAWARPAAVSLSEHGFRVVNFDYSSDIDFGEPVALTCLDQIEDALEVLDQLEIARAHLIGLSRGAVTAYGVAARHEERVGRLVLAFPVAPFQEILHVEGATPPVTEDMDQLEALDAVLDMAFSPDFLTAKRQQARDPFLAPPGSVVRVERSDEEPVDGEEAVHAPTMVIEGGNDLVVTPAHPQHLVERIDGATYHLFPDAYHGFLMERPDEFASVVADFLRR